MVYFERAGNPMLTNDVDRDTESLLRNWPLPYSMHTTVERRETTVERRG